MTEAHCDDYFLKNDEISVVCSNSNSTSSDLLQKINELSAIEAQIHSDIPNMTMPTNVIHLYKFINMQISKERKDQLQYNLYNLLKIRIEEQKNKSMNQIGTEEERMLYETETKNIGLTIQGIKANCNCMNIRDSIIKHDAYN